MTPAEQRRKSRERLDCRYREVGRLDDPCVYCGVPAISWDHIPPLSVVEAMKDVDVDMMNLRKVPACIECNSFLGAVRLTTLADRRKYVLDRLRRKYAHHLRMPHWDEDELSELSGRMVEDIERHTQFSQFIKQRTAWARTGGKQ